jgi:hypothetical protein
MGGDQRGIITGPVVRPEDRAWADGEVENDERWPGVWSKERALARSTVARVATRRGLADAYQILGVDAMDESDVTLTDQETAMGGRPERKK